MDARRTSEHAANMRACMNTRAALFHTLTLARTSEPTRYPNLNLTLSTEQLAPFQTGSYRTVHGGEQG
jgi:hypothetical protein